LEFAFPQLGEIELSRCYTTLYYPDGGNQKVTFENSSEDVLQQFFDQLSLRLGPPNGRRLLDYGCGYGRLLRIAKERGFQPTGIETDRVARQACRDKSGSDVFESIEELQMSQPRAEFDLIILWTVIEHLREPWVDLARLRALLSPGGWLYVSTMDIGCLRARLEGRRWEHYANPTHLFYFDNVSLRNAFLTAGFSNPLRWHLKFRFPHHGILRRVLYNVSSSLGLADGLIYICQKDPYGNGAAATDVVQSTRIAASHGTETTESELLVQRMDVRKEAE
jgi:SAM-dependent methyltransferase